MSYFSVRNVSFSYVNSKKILDGLAFSLKKGEIAGILGKSGIGKSTLLNIIAGFEEPDTGEVWLNGKNIVQIPACKRNIGFIFQDYALFPHLTVEKNIMFGIKDRSRKQKRSRELLELVQMQAYAKQYPYQLSGGQQQRVALARSLATDPTLLLMDEPFSNLDAELKDSLIDELKKILQSLSITTLLVSHDMEDVKKIVDTTLTIA